MSVLDLKGAQKELGLRECPHHDKPESCVDYWPRGCKNKLNAQQIGKWAKGLRLDAVVWTNLLPKFNEEENRVPTGEEVVAYLRSLEEKKLNSAKDYIQKAPRQIETEYRRRIEAELGWRCSSLI